MVKRMRILCCILTLIALGPLSAQAGGGPQVSAFTIVGPPVAVIDSVFKITVITTDANGQPIAPGFPETVNLSAFNNNDNNPVTVSPNTIGMPNTGIVDVNITLTNVNPGSWVFIQATGFGVTQPSGPSAPGIRMITAANFAGVANGFLISAPYSARPNEPFPIYITPVGSQHDGNATDAAPFTGELELVTEHGGISPDSVQIDVAAGESHCVYVTLDTVHAGNMIHVRFPSQDNDTGHEVTFFNQSQTQLDNNTDFVVHSKVFQDATSLSAQDVTSASKWQSTLWRIRSHGDKEVFEDGWNMLTFIPGAGQDGLGLHFHTMMVPSVVPRDSLPGNLSFWSAQPVTIALGSGGWVLDEENSTDPFPDGLAGNYWLRRTFFSNGSTPGTQKFNSLSFIFDSPEFDSPLELAEDDGSRDNEEEEPEPLSNFGVDKVRWDAMIWCVPAGADTVYHMIATFDVPIEDNEEETGRVDVYLTFTRSSRQDGPSTTGTFIPDDIWNENFVINQAADFKNVQGNSLPDGLDGSFWMRLQVLASPDGDDDAGWSNNINTTGQLIFPISLHVGNGVGAPGDVVSVPVRLDLDEGQEVAGIEFEMDPGSSEGFDGAVFQGAINNVPGFSISSNTIDGVTHILMVSLQGNKIGPGGDHLLMQLVFQLDEELIFGDVIDLNVFDSIVSDPGANALNHNLFSGHITVGIRGDLAGNNGQIDVTDLVALIDLILGRTGTPDNESFTFFQADINGDGKINILDAVRMINIILGKATAKQLAGPAGPMRLDLGHLQTMAGGASVVPVRAQFDGAMAGLQFTVSYDPALVSLGQAVLTPRLDGMTIQQHEVSPGLLRVVVYSAEGKTFQSSGLETLLNLPVTNLGQADGFISIGEPVAADPQGEGVSASFLNSTAKVAATPAAFSLVGNAPNPFNPSTRIAYEVPQQTRITLAVFNILGQEIVRLVDEVQAPGRYVITWNGRNSRSASVSSGVYLYRLTSGSGYTETKRMTLLK